MATRSTASTAAFPQPTIGQMVHYVYGSAVSQRGQCTPGHILDVKKNVTENGEVVGYDAERLSTVGFALIDKDTLSAPTHTSFKADGREYSRDRHTGTWHYPEDCGK